MTMQATAPRPRSMSAGTAMLRVIITLAMFLVVFIAFLIAPLIALGLGYLVYLVWHSRGSRPSSGGGNQSATGFGAGAS